MKVKINAVATFKGISNKIVKRADVLSKNVSEQCVRIFTDDGKLKIEAMNASKYIITFELEKEQVEIIEEGNIFVHAKSFENLVKPLNGLSLDINNSMIISTSGNELIIDLNSLGKRSITFYSDILEFPKTGLSQELEWTLTYSSSLLSNAFKKAIKYVAPSETIWVRGYKEDSIVQVSCKENNSGYLQLNIEETVEDDFEFYIKPDIGDILSSFGVIQLYKCRLTDTFKVIAPGVCIIFLAVNINNADLSNSLLIIDNGEEYNFVTTCKVSCNYKQLQEAIVWQSADCTEDDLNLSVDEGYLNISNNLNYPAKLQITVFNGKPFDAVSFKTSTLKNIVDTVDSPNSCIDLLLVSKSVTLGEGSRVFRWLVLVPSTKYEGVFPKGIISESIKF